VDVGDGSLEERRVAAPWRGKAAEVEGQGLHSEREEDEEEMPTLSITCLSSTALIRHRGKLPASSCLGRFL